MVIGMVPGLIASGIAVVIVWNFVADHRAAENGIGCNKNPCVIILDKRLTSVESEMRTRTTDRYTGLQAKRDREMIQQEIDNVRNECLGRMLNDRT